MLFDTEVTANAAAAAIARFGFSQLSGRRGSNGGLSIAASGRLKMYRSEHFAPSAIAINDDALSAPSQACK